jgi:hypothetical protein
MLIALRYIPVTLCADCNHLPRVEDGHLCLHGLVLEVGTEVACRVVAHEGECGDALEVDALSERSSCHEVHDLSLQLDFPRITVQVLVNHSMMKVFN